MSERLLFKPLFVSRVASSSLFAIQRTSWLRRLVVIRFVVRKVDANVVVFIAEDGRVLDLGLSDVLDDIEQSQVGPDGESPREKALARRDVLGIEIQCQLGCTGVVEQAIVVFHEL